MLLPSVRGGFWATCMLSCLFFSACSPTYDWREAKPEGGDATALFPCKPSTDARMVTLAGARVRMVIAACRAGEATWAIAHADVEDPARVAPALRALREASAGNLSGTAASVGAMKVQGMTPNPLAERVQITGRLPAGRPMVLEGGFFVRGTRVYQVTAMGETLDREALAVFFDSLKLGS